jgi:hypothetical protein
MQSVREIGRVRGNADHGEQGRVMSAAHHPPKVKVEAATRDMSVMALLFAVGSALVVAFAVLLVFLVTLPAAGLGG